MYYDFSRWKYIPPYTYTCELDPTKVIVRVIVYITYTLKLNIIKPHKMLMLLRELESDFPYMIIL